MPRKKRQLLISFLLAMSVHAAGNETNSPLVPKSNISTERLRVAISPEIMQLTRFDKSLTAEGIGARLSYAFNPQMDLGIALHQDFVAFEPLCTSLDLSYTYALTGILVRADERHFLGGSEVMHSREEYQGGLRAQLLLDQYFFSTSAYVLSLSGFGLAAYYDFPSSGNYNFQLGARADRISNGGITITPLRLFGSIAFWL